MIRSSLESLIEDVKAAGEITLADVRRLHRDVLRHGPESRDEVDILIALDRAIPVKHCSWNAFAISTIVDYVVWTARPTGYVDRETATWLISSMEAGSGPTPLAKAIAFEIACEGEKTDETLLAFVMRVASDRTNIPQLGSFS